jgi:hypothetical protein
MGEAMPAWVGQHFSVEQAGRCRLFYSEKVDLLRHHWIVPNAAEEDPRGSEVWEVFAYQEAA